MILSHDTQLQVGAESRHRYLYNNKLLGDDVLIIIYQIIAKANSHLNSKGKRDQGGAQNFN